MLRGRLGPDGDRVRVLRGGRVQGDETEGVQRRGQGEVGGHRVGGRRTAPSETNTRADPAYSGTQVQGSLLQGGLDELPWPEAELPDDRDVGRLENLRIELGKQDALREAERPDDHRVGMGGWRGGRGRSRPATARQQRGEDEQRPSSLPYVQGVPAAWDSGMIAG